MKRRWPKPPTPDPEMRPFVSAATDCLKQLTGSASGLLVYDGRPDANAPSLDWLMFLMQIGHFCLHAEKPLIFTVPKGVVVPPRLEKIADAIVRYDPNDVDSMRASLKKAMEDHVMPKIPGRGKP